MDFHVVGTFKLFPTYYPSAETLFIGNLDYIFQEIGGEYPYDVWLKTDGPTDPKIMENVAYRVIGARTLSWKEPLSLINREQTRPERQGLFGVLSVGFSAAALLTVLGFLLYALLSYQRRFVELGVLRAIGLIRRADDILPGLRAGLPDPDGRHHRHRAGRMDQQ